MDKNVIKMPFKAGFMAFELVFGIMLTLDFFYKIKTYINE